VAAEEAAMATGDDPAASRPGHSGDSPEVTVSLGGNAAAAAALCAARRTRRASPREAGARRGRSSDETRLASGQLAKLGAATREGRTQPLPANRPSGAQESRRHRCAAGRSRIHAGYSRGPLTSPPCPAGLRAKSCPASRRRAAALWCRP
jgi:hypothetical protein